MPLSPSPMSPGSSPLPEPGWRPPDNRALRLGVLAMLPALVVAILAGPLGFPMLWSVVGGFQAQTAGGLQSNTAAQFQGFMFSWSATQKNGGYTTSASLINMRSQASLFHMNAVIIPVIADMPERSKSHLYWHTSDKAAIDTLPEADYEQAIKDARAAGLVPILELQVRQYDIESGDDTSADLVGKVWANTRSKGNFSGLGGSVNQLEKGWFDNYTAFASEYARLSAKYNLPYFIIGDGLSDVTTDGPAITAKADPAGIDNGVPGESFPTCSGRRDCEWRHVIHALRAPEYANYAKHAPQQGGNYSGKLIYAASWRGAPLGDTNPEFENITWWDAVDIIGVDAYFPLSQNNADLSVNQLQSAWQGQNPCGTKDRNVCPGDIIERLSAVAVKYGKLLLFTAAGYGSVPGANSAPPIPRGSNLNNADNGEQLADMQALLETFNGQPWWAGVFWNGDAPISPRSKQPNWSASSNWAGDTLDSSKPAGQWLATYYKSNPITCSC
ncbi:MAG TPA: hypothetical protein VFQ25_07450 [Ktedonobacterales bacterium]|nr:hypothetical protein [Ktedonobacterales bacterium]